MSDYLKLAVTGLLIGFGSVQADLRLTQMEGQILLEDRETTDHCAFNPEFLVDLSHGDSIVVIEHDLSGDFADCICAFDLEVTFSSPGPGNYTVYVYRSYSAIYPPNELFFQDSIDFTVTSNVVVEGVSGLRSNCFNPATGFMNYPLAPGNEWHYRTAIIPDTDSLGVRETIQRVLGDTTMPNNLAYRIIEEVDVSGNRPPAYFYLRFDEANGIVYQYAPGDCYRDERERFNLRYSAWGTYRWNTCGDSYHASANTFEYTADSTLLIHTDTDGLIHTREDFQEGLGLIASITTEIASSYQTLVGWIIDGVQGGTLLNRKSEPSLPEGFVLHPPYPNPFNPQTSFAIDLPVQTQLVVTVYNLRGVLIWQHRAVCDAGTITLTWRGDNSSGGDIPSGLYFIRAATADWSATRKIVLVR